MDRTGDRKKALMALEHIAFCEDKSTELHFSQSEVHLITRALRAYERLMEIMESMEGRK